ncbi:hypothetical protein GLOIN_2v1789506 [Rhizophagus clarus]|uniref:Uncharacterized protein n=1 Tax=Rhizophagus clarus TaxID=94130 RepID=A0A8H3LNY0_9GLOM|nr:hypothetical protein GLOIN_2v1789506 [Rhizophagus clarus]
MSLTGWKSATEKINKNVYVIEMANADHEAAVSVLMDYFKVPNNGVLFNPPIKVLGQPFHFNPTGQGEKMTPDVAVYPDTAHVPRPGIQHPGPPPSDTNGLPHARIIVEVANTQSLDDLNKRCEKLRAGYAAPPGFTPSTKPNLQRVSLKSWDFGTLLSGTTNASACNNQAIAAFQVTIPIEDVFWNPQ